jgi:nickel transport protein
MRTFLVTLAFCAVFISIPKETFAHKVSIFAYLEGDTVFTESYFADGKGVKNGRIEVYSDNGDKLMEGITDESGNFNFKLPACQSLKIVLHASMGHRSEYYLDPGSEANRKLEKSRIPLLKTAGGIGFILGVAGIARYFLKKREYRLYASS